MVGGGNNVCSLHTRVGCPLTFGVPVSSHTSAPRTNRRVANRALGAATVAILGLTTVQVVAPEATFLPAAFAATRTIAGTNVSYDDQNPASVPWSTTVKQNVTRYGTLYLSCLLYTSDAADE